MCVRLRSECVWKMDLPFDINFCSSCNNGSLSLYIVTVLKCFHQSTYRDGDRKVRPGNFDFRCLGRAVTGAVRGDHDSLGGSESGPGRVAGPLPQGSELPAVKSPSLVPIMSTSPEPMVTARLGQMVTLSPRRLAEQPLRQVTARWLPGAGRPGIGPDRFTLLSKFSERFP